MPVLRKFVLAGSRRFLTRPWIRPSRSPAQWDLTSWNANGFYECRVQSRLSASYPAKLEHFRFQS